MEWMWGGRTIECPYPLKVQACPPRDQRPGLRSRDSGQEGNGCMEASR